LHGRAGNLPARELRLELDEAHSLLHVMGEIHETRFLQYNLRLSVKYTFAIAENAIHIHDVVTNAGATPTTMQLLYHINLGQPLLEPRANLQVGAERAVARNAHAAGGLATWSTYEAPTLGFVEQVYFFSAKPDASGWAKALLSSADAQRGFAVHYRPETLPFFTQWKNTVAEADGYVTGLEPGTGFPNPRSFEEEHGRLVTLGPAETREFHLKLEGIASPSRVAQLQQDIESTRSGPMETSEFEPDWCVPGS
jgi:galactose mutarotase-like enzyme